MELEEKWCCSWTGAQKVEVEPAEQSPGQDAPAQEDEWLSQLLQHFLGDPRHGVWRRRQGLPGRSQELLSISLLAAGGP